MCSIDTSSPHIWLILFVTVILVPDKAKYLVFLFQESILLCDQRTSAISSPDDEAFYCLHSHVCSMKEGQRTSHVQFPLKHFCEVCITYESLISKSFSYIVSLS